jgi:hypothetical protein
MQVMQNSCWDAGTLERCLLTMFLQAAYRLYLLQATTTDYRWPGLLPLLLLLVVVVSASDAGFASTAHQLPLLLLLTDELRPSVSSRVSSNTFSGESCKNRGNRATYKMRTLNSYRLGTA